MSGHSHWATIRRKKSVIDAKKGKEFSRCSKLIMSAARIGGSNPEMNAALRDAIEEARSINMPRDRIERAIKKGAGELEGERLEATTYEGYGPGGVALLIEVLTDNRNRTASQIRLMFESAGGSLAGPGSVAWMFHKKGVLSVKADVVSEDRLLEIILDAGAEDLRRFDDIYEITCEPTSFSAVRQALTDNGLVPETAQIANIAKQNVTPSLNDARKALKLMEELEEHDDVQSVSANFDIPAELMAEVA